MLLLRSGSLLLLFILVIDTRNRLKELPHTWDLLQILAMFECVVKTLLKHIVQLLTAVDFMQELLILVREDLLFLAEVIHEE